MKRVGETVRGLIMTGFEGRGIENMIFVEDFAFVFMNSEIRFVISLENH